MYTFPMAEIVTLLFLAALVWVWFDSMRARERALALGRRACERGGLMFLDETVECVSLRPARDHDGRFALRRTYAFEFSDTGNNRRSGNVVMLGGEAESVYTEPYLIQ
jgi:hypothetical protein